MGAGPIAHGPFTGGRGSPRPFVSGRAIVTDALLIVLGTAGFLLMAGYAALCDRI